MPVSDTPSVPCPNCAMPWPGNALVCPNCGYIGPAVPAWPPPIAGMEIPFAPPAPMLVTGKVWGDMTLGIVISFLSSNFAGIGYIVMPILYFTLRAKYPVFARGIGFGLLPGLVLILGALTWCIASLVLSR